MCSKKGPVILSEAKNLLSGIGPFLLGSGKVSASQRNYC